MRHVLLPRLLALSLLSVSSVSWANFSIGGAGGVPMGGGGIRYGGIGGMSTDWDAGTPSAEERLRDFIKEKYKDEIHHYVATHVTRLFEHLLPNHEISEMTIVWSNNTFADTFTGGGRDYSFKIKTRGSDAEATPVLCEAERASAKISDYSISRILECEGLNDEQRSHLEGLYVFYGVLRARIIQVKMDEWKKAAALERSKAEAAKKTETPPAAAATTQVNAR